MQDPFAFEVCHQRFWKLVFVQFHLFLMSVNEYLVISFIKCEKFFLVLVVQRGNVHCSFSVFFHNTKWQESVFCVNSFDALEVVHCWVKELATLKTIVLLRSVVLSKLFHLMLCWTFSRSNFTEFLKVVNHSDFLMSYFWTQWPITTVNELNCSLIGLPTFLSASCYWAGCGSACNLTDCCHWIFEQLKLFHAHL